MKKMLLGLGIFAALMVGFFSIVPLKKANAYTWYTVYKYNKVHCNSVNTSTHLCTSAPIDATVYQTVNLAAPASASCPAPAYELISFGQIDYNTHEIIKPPVYAAWVSAGVTTSQIQGLSCVVGPGI